MLDLLFRTLLAERGGDAAHEGLSKRRRHFKDLVKRLFAGNVDALGEDMHEEVWEKV